MQQGDHPPTRAILARVIQQIVHSRGWSQREAAAVLGIAPSDMSDLARDKLSRFSEARLVRFLNALDMDVRIQIEPRPAWKPHAGVSVEVLDPDPISGIPSSTPRRLEPEDVCEPEWAAWYRLTPAQRWTESARLWPTYLSLGGSLDPEPDTQSPFHDAHARRPHPAHGRAGVHRVRRGGV